MPTRASYYRDGPVECEDVIAHVTQGVEGERAFCLGNVVKYVYRAGRKSGDPVEDLDKARDYAHRLVYGRWFDEQVHDDVAMAD